MAEALLHGLAHVRGKWGARTGEGMADTVGDFRTGGVADGMPLHGRYRDTAGRRGAGHHVIGDAVGFPFECIVGGAGDELVLQAVVFPGARAAFAFTVTVRAAAAFALQPRGPGRRREGGSMGNGDGCVVAHGGTPRLTGAA
ncbi:hypothetical protein GCM10009121_14980 [Rhodanobacter soli]